jgi:hypothetical protein
MQIPIETQSRSLHRESAGNRLLRSRMDALLARFRLLLSLMCVTATASCVLSEPGAEIRVARGPAPRPNAPPARPTPLPSTGSLRGTILRKAECKFLSRWMDYGREVRNSARVPALDSPAPGGQAWGSALPSPRSPAGGTGLDWGHQPACRANAVHSRLHMELPGILMVASEHHLPTVGGPIRLG